MKKVTPLPGDVPETLEALPDDLVAYVSTERMPLDEGVGLTAWVLEDGALALNKPGSKSRAYPLHAVDGQTGGYELDLSTRQARARHLQTGGDLHTHTRARDARAQATQSLWSA